MKVLLIAIFLVFAFSSPRLAAEDVTITTYYPSPYGSYAELFVSTQFTIGNSVEEPGRFFMRGDIYQDGSLYQRGKQVGFTTTDWLVLTAQTGWIGLTSPQLITMEAPDIDLKGTFKLIGDESIVGNFVENGNMLISGNVGAHQFCIESDARFKRNIKELSGVLDKIKNIKGVAFDWRTDEFPDKRFEKGTHIGIIAQEVEKEFPELINTDKQGYKSLDYDKFNAILLEAVKEQQKEIESLKNKISELAAK